MRQNILLLVDSYKHSHFLQYPEGTEETYSYIESRGGIHSEIVVFGFQYLILKYLTKPFTQEDIDEAADVCAAHGVPFNREGFEYILNTYDGYFPVIIDTIPEGTVVPTGVPIATIHTVDPKAAFCTSFIETLLLQVWYPITVATNSREIKKVIKQYLDKTGTPESIDFKLHDFGCRGTSSMESAMIGGMAHLVNFKGTDTMPALIGAKRYYGADMAGFSIPAAEHSTITSWGKEGEVDAYRNMIAKFSRPGSIYAVVSDSYDLDNAVKNLWGKELREAVIKSGGTLVIRPDSGNPRHVPVQTVQQLDKIFGSTVNEKGYKVLNHVRVIQGDGIDIDVIASILGSLTRMGYSADNIAFGMGGALLQGVNRDDQRFAMKMSAIRVNGEWRDVFKAPKDDPKKRSKAGLVTTRITDSGKYIPSVVNWQDDQVGTIALELAYSGVKAHTNGNYYLNPCNFDDVRRNAEVK